MAAHAKQVALRGAPCLPARACIVRCSVFPQRHSLKPPAQSTRSSAHANSTSQRLSSPAAQKLFVTTAAAASGAVATAQVGPAARPAAAAGRSTQHAAAAQPDLPGMLCLHPMPAPYVTPWSACRAGFRPQACDPPRHSSGEAAPLKMWRLELGLLACMCIIGSCTCGQLMRCIAVGARWHLHTVSQGIFRACSSCYGDFCRCVPGTLRTFRVAACLQAPRTSAFREPNRMVALCSVALLKPAQHMIYPANVPETCHVPSSAAFTCILSITYT